MISRVCTAFTVFAALLAPIPARALGSGEVSLNRPARTWQGLYLDVSQLEKTTPEANPFVRVLDMSGNLVHAWRRPLPFFAFAELVKPLPDGHLLALTYDRRSAGTGQTEKLLLELDWDGNVVWSFDARPMGFQLHHDFERVANGNTFVLAQRAASFPALNPGPVLDEYILEVDGGGNVVWSWSIGSRANQLPLTGEGFSYLYNFPGGTPAPIFHCNSFQCLPPNPWAAQDPRFAQGNLMISLRETNLVLIVERSSGDIVWSYQGAIGQHHARLIPEGLPGAGNILLFDNGGTSGAPPIHRKWSRVLEIDPVTQKTLWKYETAPVSSLFGKLTLGGVTGGFMTAAPFFATNTMGGCQRLPNGNTLVTESEHGRVFEVDRKGRIVWQLRKHGAERVYRSYRVDGAWQTMDDLFPW